MEVYTIKVGPNLTNCYIIKDNDKSYIIDPGDDGDKILSFIKSNSLNVKNIILTHGHFDHIGAVGFLREKLLSMNVSIHVNDNINLSDANKNLSHFLGNKMEFEKAEVLLKEGDIIGNFRVISTPGHTPGSISLYNEKEKTLFSGDLIFDKGTGRTDLPGGDHETLFGSINKIMELSDDIIVYPGHGSTTTIGDFKKFFI